MKTNTPTALLRIFISSTDHIKQDLLSESIVFSAKKEGLAGATVLKGILGYGASSVIHSYKFWEISEKVPIVLEIVDNHEKIISYFENIRSQLESMRYGCLATIEKVEVVLYKSGDKRISG